MLLARKRLPVGIVLLTIIIIVVLGAACKPPKKRQMEAARRDSLKRDSINSLYAPDQSRQRSSMYDRERENLGNLDSLVTPQQPAVQR